MRSEFNIKSPTALAIGKFDGLHIGHKALLSLLPNNEGLKAALFSFNPTPAEVLRGEGAAFLLSHSEKAAALRGLGLDYFIEYPFNKDFAALSPEAFVKDILLARLNCQKLVIGQDYRFGMGRQGDAAVMANLGKSHGISVVVINDKELNGTKISSCGIKAAIKQKDLAQARVMLGYNFFVSGPVIHGNKMGGRLGFATANISPPPEKLLPPRGAYITRTRTPFGVFKSITNIGTRPTLQNNAQISIETHLLNFAQSLYGEDIKVEFMRWLRDERRFDSLDDLSRQLQSDTQAAESYPFCN